LVLDRRWLFPRLGHGHRGAGGLPRAAYRYRL